MNQDDPCARTQRGHKEDTKCVKSTGVQGQQKTVKLLR